MFIFFAKMKKKVTSRPFLTQPAAGLETEVFLVLPTGLVTGGGHVKFYRYILPFILRGGGGGECNICDI